MVRNRKLAKSIHDAGWGTFLRWLKYYATVHGTEVIAVPPHYTTQNCSGCGTKVQKSLSVRTHICPKCGLVMDRDQNAALNILHKALEKNCSSDDKGTEGHSGTSTDVAVQNASGQFASTASPRKRSRGKRAG